MEPIPNPRQIPSRKRYRRIPYGRETIPWDTRIPCHDCGAVVGQLHRRGCDAEECARCAGQKVSCDCGDSGNTGKTLCERQNAGRWGCR